MEEILESLLATVTVNTSAVNQHCASFGLPIDSNVTTGDTKELNCTYDDDETYDYNFRHTNLSRDDHSVAKAFFTYFSPFIFCIGVGGNIINLVVFLSKGMRNLPASTYLAALSIFDLMALLFYVLTEWIKRGMPEYHGHVTAPFLEQHGMCQILLYLQYVSRFLSSWIIVCFTAERYFGVCHPFKRMYMCDTNSSLRIIFGLIVISGFLCIFKPILSGVHKAGKHGVEMCTSSRDHPHLSFILDSTFAVTITLVPFLIITILNIFIVRKLMLRNRNQRKIHVITEENKIRLEFTFILIGVSICFAAFNLPYFTVWCTVYWSYKDILGNSSQQDVNNAVHNLQDILLATRTIFYINYCINFFLYSITGAHFRKELKRMFSCKEKVSQLAKGSYVDLRKTSLDRTVSQTNEQSWV